MATYYSDRVNSLGTHAIKGGTGIVYDECTVTIGSVALATNDVIHLFTVPAGAVVRSLSVIPVGAVQSGTDSVFTVGDLAGDTDRYYTTSSGTSLRSNNIYYYDGLFGGALATNNTPYATDTTIIMTITTGGTGMAADKAIVVRISYFME